jgi:hypothetical protein
VSAAMRRGVGGATLAAKISCMVFLAWDVPASFFIIKVGDAVGAYFEMSPPVTIGVIVVMSSTWPRGIVLMLEALIMPMFGGLPNLLK